MNLEDGDVDHQGDGVFLSGQVELGSRGCLLVLADGMGGMNAGEVASALAVSSISNYFSTQMPVGKEYGDEEAFAFIEHSVLYADECIKTQAAKNPDQSGLGTTIVILWLLGGKAYVAWCGDSRIYRYNTFSGELERLSHDHSLVQFWMDSGQLTEEEAFRHPQSNIIMRSLGDAPEPVELEMLKAPLSLHHGDVFLLCSDGLCGVLRDREIVQVLHEASGKYPPAEIDKWNDMLWQAAEDARWTDNVTSMLCFVQDGEGAECASFPEPAEDVAEPEPSHPEGHRAKNPATVTPTGTAPMKKAAGKRRMSILLVVLLVLAALAVAGLLFLKWRGATPKTGAPDRAASAAIMQVTTNSI
jgi:serine/threonine protein phosphatase PrpC